MVTALWGYARDDLGLHTERRMLYAAIFNVFVLLLALGIGARILPVAFLTGLITGLHFTIGITTPTPDQIRRATVVWLISLLVIIDVLFALLRWVI